MPFYTNVLYVFIYTIIHISYTMHVQVMYITHDTSRIINVRTVFISLQLEQLCILINSTHSPVHRLAYNDACSHSHHRAFTKWNPITLWINSAKLLTTPGIQIPQGFAVVEQGTWHLTCAYHYPGMTRMGTIALPRQRRYDVNGQCLDLRTEDTRRICWHRRYRMRYRINYIWKG
jgi:hypothetical protein